MFKRAKEFWTGRKDAEELSPTIHARLKHVLIDNIVYRRINPRRDKRRGNHYVTHFRVKHTHGSKTETDGYIGMLNLGHIILPKRLVGKLVKVEIRVFDDRILPENPTFLKEKDILEDFRK